MDMKKIGSVLVVLVALVALYFMCSPYERCMRTCKITNCTKYCTANTHW